MNSFTRWNDNKKNESSPEIGLLILMESACRRRRSPSDHSSPRTKRGRRSFPNRACGLFPTSAQCCDPDSSHSEHRQIENTSRYRTGLPQGLLPPWSPCKRMLRQRCQVSVHGYLVGARSVSMETFWKCTTLVDFWAPNRRFLILFRCCIGYNILESFSL